jgi:hypothetical protein
MSRLVLTCGLKLYFLSLFFDILVWGLNAVNGVGMMT